MEELKYVLLLIYKKGETMEQEILMTIFKWGIPIVLTGITTMIVKIYKDMAHEITE